MTHEQTDADLVAHLCEQVGFLKSSAAAYDAGDDSEAKRMSVPARVLCHNTSSSRSLLGQLGLIETIEFIDSAPSATQEGDPAPGESDEPIEWIEAFFSPLAPIGGGRRGYRPRLAEGPRSPSRGFESWWNAPVLGGSDGVSSVSFSRRDIVLALAHQDGGAHVDPRLTETYATMARLSALGKIEYATSDGSTREADASPALAVMRQIAWELIESLAPVVGA